VTLASLAVAASAPAESGSRSGAMQAPAAWGMLGGGPGGMLGVTSAGDRGPAPRVAHGRSAGRWLRHGSAVSRGHGFVRGAGGFTRLDVPGSRLTAASGSNGEGRVVGYHLDDRKRFHGFVYDGRRFRRIDVPGAKGTFPAGIDDHGRVVGYYTDERGTPAVRSAEHGFLLDKRGRFRSVDVPGAIQTRPEAINNRGQIAGAYLDRAGILHGYLQDRDGSVTVIDPPGAGTSVVTDIDDQGRTVGAYVDARQTAITAFVREPDGSFTTISHPDAGFYGTVPEGIDNRGRIAGTYADADNRTYGFVLDDGAFTTVDDPGAPGNTQVLDIDDAGRLVGTSGHVSYGYLAGGREEPIELDAPAVASDTFPVAINGRGEIVGSADRGAARSYHGFLRDRRGRYRRIEVPGAKGTAATGINDDRDVVGSYSDTNDNPNTATDVRGFLLDRRGRLARIDVAGATATQPLGINNHDEIVGAYVDGNGAAHGFLRDRDGRVTTVDVPGAQVTVVFDVNDSGTMVGIYLDGDGRLRGFQRDRAGQVTTIDAPGAIQTRVRGINNRGQIAIDTVDSQLVHHGFLLEQGRFTEIRPRGAAGNGSLATDVDDRGNVLGYVL
jgi:hypothetical protein